MIDKPWDEAAKRLKKGKVYLVNPRSSLLKLRGGMRRSGDERLAFEYEGTWKEISGKNWLASAMEGNLAAMGFASRAVPDERLYRMIASDPALGDGAVLYGHIGALGYLIHASELQEEKR